MTKEDEFIRLTGEIDDSLCALTTYLKRHGILLEKIDKYIYRLPPELIGEFGEFLVDFGEGIQKFGTINKQREEVILKLLGLEK